MELSTEFGRHMYYTPGSKPTAKVRLVMVVRAMAKGSSDSLVLKASTLARIFARIVVGVNQMVELG